MNASAQHRAPSLGSDRSHCDPLEVHRYIRTDAIALLPPSKALQRQLLSQLRGNIASALDAANERLHAAGHDQALLIDYIAHLPTTSRFYTEIVAERAQGGPRSPDANAIQITSDTPERYATLHRRAAKGGMRATVRLAIYAVATVWIVAVELAVLHANLELRFPVVVGQPEAVIGKGPIVGLFFVVVAAGFFAFESVSARTKRMIDGLARIACIPYLIGIGIFAAASITAGLGLDGAQSATQFSNLQEGLQGQTSGLLSRILEFAGDLGFAAALCMITFLAFFAVEGCLQRIRVHARDCMRSGYHLREAWRIEQRAKRNAAVKVRERRIIGALNADLENAPRAVAEHVASIVAPIAAAAESLLIQRDLNPSSESDVLPDAMSAEVAMLDQDALRKRIETLRAKSDADFIEADLRAWIASPAASLAHEGK